uniref:Uncharacterized protein n=1 Tax=Amphimedon queenslandica TaxID=400682 RepID=A0A1X7UNW4_AMPQE
MDDNGTNCRQQFETPTFVAIASLRAMMGSLSLLGSVFVIFIIMYLKKYVLYTQRLVLYLSITVGLNAIAVISQAGVYLPMESEAVKIYCQISGYLSQSTDWSELVAICLVTFDLYLTAVMNVKSKREVIQFLLIFFLPLGVNLLPFIGSSYGPSGPWCWIKTYNDDCSKSQSGKIFQILLWYVPITLMIFFLIITYIAIYYKLRQQKKQYISCRSESNACLIRLRQMIQKEIKPLVLYPVLFLFFNFFTLLNGLASQFYSEPIRTLWLLEALITPFVGVAITLVYTLDPETRKRLQKCDLRTDYRNRVQARKRILDFPLLTPPRSDSKLDTLKKKDLEKAKMLNEEQLTNAQSSPYVNLQTLIDNDDENSNK